MEITTTNKVCIIILFILSTIFIIISLYILKILLYPYPFYESKILKKDDKFMLSNLISSSKIETHLLYRASRDGIQRDNFYLYCENKGPTVTIILSENNIILGGYTSINWTKGHQKYMTDYNAFLFSIDLKEKYSVLKPTLAIFNGNYQYGINFGSPDLAIVFDYKNPNIIWGKYVQNNYSIPPILKIPSKGIIDSLFNITDYEVFSVKIYDKN